MRKTKIVILFICSIYNACLAKSAIVIGASAGMGKEVAKRLSQEGYELGLVARREPLLKALQAELAGPSYIVQIDIAHPDARKQLMELITQMKRVDLVVISVSAYLDNRNATATNENDFHPARAWEQKEKYIDVDAKGFIAMADVALEHFSKNNHGHLVGISSTSGLRGHSYNPEYCAAKACISTYMEGMRNYMAQNNINVQITDVIPGFVAVEHSPLGQDPTAFWEITVQEAGNAIMDGIKAQKKVIYVPPKIRLVAWLLKWLPDCVYNNYFSWM